MIALDLSLRLSIIAQALYAVFHFFRSAGLLVYISDDIVSKVSSERQYF